ncbi:MAG: hypothetical protein U9Q06_03775 [Nanoarchaeota archaeon]|nr:hypothetical protein [Nanoarchaeota archaeon]
MKRIRVISTISSDGRLGSYCRSGWFFGGESEKRTQNIENQIRENERYLIWRQDLIAGEHMVTFYTKS